LRRTIDSSATGGVVGRGRASYAPAAPELLADAREHERGAAEQRDRRAGEEEIGTTVKEATSIASAAPAAA
jgi:hypothetical protein